MLFVPGFYKTLWNYFCHLENLNKNRAPYFNKVAGNLETCVGVLRRCCVCNIRNIIRQQQAGGRAGLARGLTMSFMKMADMPALSQGHTLWNTLWQEAGWAPYFSLMDPNSCSIFILVSPR